MKLRQWQAECSKIAINRFKKGQKHVFVLATPGAGKTVMAAWTAHELHKNGLIDYVVCFAPSLSVLEGMRVTFSSILNRPMNGLLGAAGGVFSYQYLANSKTADWSFLKNHRVLVIFDEIHHCSGDDPEIANAWGREIISNIALHARFVLSMTGTPWRSDLTKISLATYIVPEGTIKCDYSYGLSKAIQDGVCRLPLVTLIDNDQLKVAEKTFNSLGAAIKQSELRYSEILKNDYAVKYLIGLAVKKLEFTRVEQPNSAGLVVASSVEEAMRIQQMLCIEFEQPSIVVSYKDQDAHKKINDFRTSDAKWIISIGMISEGTDIPRLRVCVHLSLIRTELFFRQVLGRILRLIPGISNDKGWLFSFAEPSLVEFAQRLEQDIPFKILKIETLPDPAKLDNCENDVESPKIPKKSGSDSSFNGPWKIPEPEDLKKHCGQNNQSLLFSLQGQYRQQVYSIF